MTYTRNSAKKASEKVVAKKSPSPPKKHEVATISSPIDVKSTTPVVNYGTPTDVKGLPVLDLASFGISPAKKRDRDRDSVLKAVIVPKSAIIWKIEPKDPTISAWSEKVFFDCIRANSDWVAALNFENMTEKWFHENKEQQNPKGYPFRLFVQRVEGEIPEKQLFEMGKYISSKVTSQPGNTTKLLFDGNESSIFKDNAVWSDVVGYDRALELLKRETGQPSPGYYEKWNEKIHLYFRHGTLSQDLARILYAPNIEISPHDNAAYYPGMDDSEGKEGIKEEEEEEGEEEEEDGEMKEEDNEEDDWKMNEDKDGKDENKDNDDGDDDDEEDEDDDDDEEDDDV